jgi:ADP-heptose:LPS heptosyltransferase/GT2 family glycosyltransferase
MNKPAPNYGLTPEQIRKAIKGDRQGKEDLVSLISTKGKAKPEKSFRQAQNGDNGLLLNLPFSTTQSALHYPTPDWFTTKHKADVSVIVPIYNTSAKAIVDSWDLGNDGLRVELIYVDDACPVNSKDLVLKEWESRKTELKAPVGKIYYSAVKQGWSACCNIGAEKASGDIIVFLHPDIKLEQGWLKPMVRQIRKSDVGAVGCLQVNPDTQTFVDAGSEWTWDREEFMEIGRFIYKGHVLGRPFQITNTPPDLLESGEREKVSSYCMAVRKKDFRYLGGFCPNLQSVEWADTDFCMNLKEHNFKVLAQCTTQVSRPVIQKRDRHFDHGQTYFRNKWVISGRIEPLVVAKRATQRPEVENIVIRRRAAHGDVLVASAVCPALKKKHPGAKIIFSTDCPEVLANNPWIDKVVEATSERWFDLYYDLDMVYEYRPDANMLDAYAEAVGVPRRDCDMFLHTEPIEGLPESYVVMHAGKTMWAGRNWSTLKFDALSNKLRAAGHKVVCVGTWSDHKTTSCDLDLREKTTVGQLATVIMNAKMFVGIDSFPMHVAQVFEVPGACFFGAIKPETRLFNKAIRPIFSDGLKCLGCHHRKPTPCTATTTCEVGIQDCINNVSAEHFWRAINDFGIQP